LWLPGGSLTLSVVTTLVKTPVVTEVNGPSPVALDRLRMRQLRRTIKQSKPFQSLEQEVFLEVLRTGHALVHDLVELLRPHGLTQPQYNVLRILRGAGEAGLPTGEVGDRMVASREPDVTRLLVRMERRGLLARQRRVENRRVVTVRITRLGRRILEALDRPVADMHVAQLRHMSRRELEQLAELLERLREGLEAPPAAGKMIAR
jgi:DNA-binding MarR family transcriptional regulator